MFKYFSYTFLSLFVICKTFANDINIQENINISFKCELEKKNNQKF